MAYKGKNGVSAYGVLMYTQLVFLAIEIGYSIGSAPIISYNYGAKNTDELKNVFKKSMIILNVSGICLSALAQALAVPMAKIFVRNDPDLFNLTVHAFRLFSFGFAFSGITIFASGFFTALNNGLISAILSFARSIVFQITPVLVLPLLLGVDGIWYSFLTTEACAFVVCVSFFLAEKKRYGY